MSIEKAIAKARKLQLEASASMTTEHAVQEFGKHLRGTHNLVWDVVEQAHRFVNGRAEYERISLAEQRMIDALDALARAVNGGE